MMRRMPTVLLAAMMLTIGLMMLAEAEENDGRVFDTISAWTSREVDALIAPHEGAQAAFSLAPDAVVSLLAAEGDWAYVNAYGDIGYVPVDALTTDRVFRFDSYPARSMDWLYAGELRVSPDGVVRIEISMAEKYEDMSVFGGAELLCFEVIDEHSGDLVCTAELDPSSNPKTYIGEGMYTQGSALLVRPVLWHDGYSVEIQW